MEEQQTPANPGEKITREETEKIREEQKKVLISRWGAKTVLISRYGPRNF